MNSFFENLKRFGDMPCMVSGDKIYSYEDLIHQALTFKNYIGSNIPPGSVAGAVMDYSFLSIALFLAMSLNHNIIIPLSKDAGQKHKDFMKIGMAGYLIEMDGNGKLIISQCPANFPDNEHYKYLKVKNHSGLVLFSSGSSGPPKGIVHDLNRLVKAYEKPGKSLRTLIFLQMDHIGGINTLLYNLRNQGVIVIPNSRMPEDICRCIADHGVELLPTSPTFLNLLLLSETFSNHDLSCLKMVTYGTEPMPEGTLKRLKQIFPKIRFKQTYGLSETGILKTKSRDDDSLWVKVGGKGFDVKVKDGKLWIRSGYSMLGYLNAENPFEEDGYINTGDMVETQGEWIKILGRESELINVGGNKVFPAEIESVLQKMPEIGDVVVFGKPNPITGQMVAALVKPCVETSVSELKKKIRRFCKSRLESYKIPVKIKLTRENLYSDRFKKKRTQLSETIY